MNVPDQIFLVVKRFFDESEVLASATTREAAVVIAEHLDLDPDNIVAVPLYTAAAPAVLGYTYQHVGVVYDSPRMDPYDYETHGRTVAPNPLTAVLARLDGDSWELRVSGADQNAVNALFAVRFAEVLARTAVGLEPIPYRSVTNDVPS